MKYFPFLLFCCLTSALKAQVYPLHPSIGDTLDRLEKLDYSLFPEIENQDFNFATIQYRKENFYLDAAYENSDSLQSFMLNQASIIEAQQNIEKVNTYYRYLEQQAKQEKRESALGSVQSEINTLHLDGPMAEQMKKESRMHTRLKEDARRTREFQQGLRPREVHIEFK